MLLVSVTKRISQVKQPVRGYLPFKSMEEIVLNSAIELVDMENENISPAIVGTAVDYLTRFMLTGNVDEAFKIALYGSKLARQEAYGQQLAKNIVGLDTESIKNACKLVGFDSVVRAGLVFYKPIKDANLETTGNIKEMVNRSLKFFSAYGPVIKDGFTFEGGYTNTINAGDGDFLTADTLWDFKVSKYPPKKEHTLQLLIYYFMGKNSIHDYFKPIKNIGLFNPRLNTVYLYKVEDLEPSYVIEINQFIIGYPKPE